MHYQRRGNTFTWLEDVAQAQTLFNQQLEAHGPDLLGGLASALNPLHEEIFANYPCRYYWTVRDSEWASDVMLRSRPALPEVYPQLLRYAIATFGTAGMHRFFGQAVPADGKVPHRCRQEVQTSLKERGEGVRIKHWLNGNSLKLSDKGSVLRVEATLRQPGGAGTPGGAYCRGPGAPSQRGDGRCRGGGERDSRRCPPPTTTGACVEPPGCGRRRVVDRREPA
jgi:hypothetical protein